jgi:tetratricopeptide (TPR) repeat protein
MRRLILIVSFLGLVTPSARTQTPEEQLDRYAQEAQRALSEQRYDDAARAFEKLRELSPQTAEVHAQLGAIYFQQLAFAKAIPSLRQALKLRPDLPKVDVLLALCLSEVGQFKEALPGLRKAFNQSEDAPLRRLGGLQLQRAYTDLEQDDKAVEVALEMSRLYPDDPEVLYYGGRLFANFAYLQTLRLRKVAPDSVFLHQAMGEANESQGYFEAAVREYREVLAVAPRKPGIHLRMGRALLSRAKQLSADGAATARSEAMKEFLEELRIDPTSANAAYELGEIHRQSGEMEKAAEFFTRAVQHYPDFDQAQIGLGRVLARMGQPGQALPHLQKAVSLNPGSEVAYYQLAQCQRALGNEAAQRKALAEFQRLQSQRPKDPDLTSLVPTEVTRQELDPKPAPQ